jgi:hypothetical protein
MSWEDEFRRRMKMFGASFPPPVDSVPVSIKVRLSSGCFHREHSPNAYKIIDEYLVSHPDSNLGFEEHESGPELLVYLAAITAGVSLTASIIDLVTAIINARTDGIKRGDRPDAPLELIIGGFDEKGKLREEKVLRIASVSDADKEQIGRALLDSASKLAPGNKSKKKGRGNK